MPTITIDGQECTFEQGQTILQVASANGIAIPQYCYHDGLSIVASCRICLAEVWAPNPRNDNKLEAIPKLLPTCQTPCAEGQVVYTKSPKSIANQKAVMEYLLINHPTDCAVCDQAGECYLQDYSYEYGRGVSRFQEAKVKQPKKNLGPHVYLYADRCIMCTRCVRFTREVTGTAELIVAGRGNHEQIDVFPGVALDNELSANVVDLCPVGALLDKDFLFAQRVWFLRSTPSIDGITASGDNILVEHNGGEVYRIKPRTNLEVNKWWISDEIRYGYRFVHDESRITQPRDRSFGRQAACTWGRAFKHFVDTFQDTRCLLLLSPMLSCEDAFLLVRMAQTLASDVTVALGPVPRSGEDKTFPGGYTVRAEKAPNARGVRRVIEALCGGACPSIDEIMDRMHSEEFQGVIASGNYPSEWVTEELAGAIAGKKLALLDTLPNRLTETADVLLPVATWVEKAGTFENAEGLLQAFEQAIPEVGLAKSEAQIALDVLAILDGALADAASATVDPAVPGLAADDGHDPDATRLERPEAAPGQVPSAKEVAAPIDERANAAMVRQRMAGEVPALALFATDVAMPSVKVEQRTDMELLEI